MKQKVVVLILLVVFGLISAVTVLAVSMDKDTIVVKGDANYRAVYRGIEVRLVSVADKYVFDPQWKYRERRVLEALFSVQAITDEGKPLFKRMNLKSIDFRPIGLLDQEYGFSDQSIRWLGDYQWEIAGDRGGFPSSFKKVTDANGVIRLNMVFSPAQKVELIRWELQDVAPNKPLNKELGSWKGIFLGVSQYQNINGKLVAVAKFKLESTLPELRDFPQLDLVNIRNDLKKEFTYDTNFVEHDLTNKKVQTFIYNYTFNVAEADLSAQRKWTFTLKNRDDALQQNQPVCFEFTLP